MSLITLTIILLTLNHAYAIYLGYSPNLYEYWNKYDSIGKTPKFEQPNIKTSSEERIDMEEVRLNMELDFLNRNRMKYKHSLMLTYHKDLYEGLHKTYEAILKLFSVIEIPLTDLVEIIPNGVPAGSDIQLKYLLMNELDFYDSLVDKVDIFLEFGEVLEKVKRDIRSSGNTMIYGSKRLRRLRHSYVLRDLDRDCHRVDTSNQNHMDFVEEKKGFSIQEILFDKVYKRSTSVYDKLERGKKKGTKEPSVFHTPLKFPPISPPPNWFMKHRTRFENFVFDHVEKHVIESKKLFSATQSSLSFIARSWIDCKYNFSFDFFKFLILKKRFELKKNMKLLHAIVFDEFENLKYCEAFVVQYELARKILVASMNNKSSNKNDVLL